jgi:hypothetical protein
MRPFRFMTIAAPVLGALSFAQAATTTPASRPPPEFPDAAQTATWTAPTNVMVAERLPAKQPDFEKALARAIKQNPDKLGLPNGVNLRIDSVQIVPEAEGISPMAMVHLTQVVDGTPVAGTEVAMVIQWTANGSPVRIARGKLYPDVKTLPEKAVGTDEAERKVWTKLSSELTRFGTEPGGTWVRWIDGKWRTVQLYGVNPQTLIAAVDGSGEVYVWSGRLVSVSTVTAKSNKSL